jgi:hypothetical protein
VVFAPHLSSHDTGVVGAISYGYDGGVIDQVGYLLSIVFVSRGKVDSGQLSFGVDCSVELKAVVAPLPVVAKASDRLCYLVTAGSH